MWGWVGKREVWIREYSWNVCTTIENNAPNAASTGGQLPAAAAAGGSEQPLDSKKIPIIGLGISQNREPKSGMNT